MIAYLPGILLGGGITAVVCLGLIAWAFKFPVVRQSDPTVLSITPAE